MTKNTKKEEALNQKIAELDEDLKRAQADLFNVRRRAEEDKLRISTNAKQAVILELVPVLDNLNRALINAPEDVAETPYFKGVISVAKQIQVVLSDLGVMKIETVGNIFDPNTMEAISVEGEGDSEVVTEELQAGYTVNNSVIRVAMVKVKRQ
jgi:molecular chaperone GrpE